jgi:molybdenum cofactor cytidylyltransferase
MKYAKVAGIMLAAGNSQRMGEDKLSLAIGDTTIGSASLRNALASQLDQVFIVVQENDPLHWMTDEVKRQSAKYQVVQNAQAYHGQSYSIRAGIEQVQDSSFDGALIMLADQPFLQVSIINELIHIYNEEIPFIAAQYAGVTQPPILFNSFLFERLLTLQGDQGAKAIVKSMKNNGYIMKGDDRKSFYDIDTKDDYRWAKKWQEQL